MPARTSAMPTGWAGAASGGGVIVHALGGAAAGCADGDGEDDGVGLGFGDASGVDATGNAADGAAVAGRPRKIAEAPTAATASSVIMAAAMRTIATGRSQRPGPGSGGAGSRSAARTVRSN